MAAFLLLCPETISNPMILLLHWISYRTISAFTSFWMNSSTPFAELKHQRLLIFCLGTLYPRFRAWLKAMATACFGLRPSMMFFRIFIDTNLRPAAVIFLDFLCLYGITNHFSSFKQSFIHFLKFLLPLQAVAQAAKSFCCLVGFLRAILISSQ